MAPRIEQIIENEAIISLYQPLVSVGRKDIVGVEALSRAPDSTSGFMTSPRELFSEAEAKGLLLPLDRICRKKAMEGFAGRFNDPGMVLSINIDASVINTSSIGSNHIMNIATSLTLNPRNILIEIVESRVEDPNILESFVRAYRAHGFLIGLDDVGSGFSNWERISSLKPDVIKIDRHLVNGIGHGFHCQESVRSIVMLSHTLGALVVAEGIEDREQAMKAMELGCDILQGFHFSRPVAIDGLPFAEIQSKMDAITTGYRKHMITSVRRRREVIAAYNAVRDAATKAISLHSTPEFDPVLFSILESHRTIECIYVLDSSGVQVSDTVCKEEIRRCVKNPIFRPAETGMDHSFKDYFYHIRDGKENYTSKPYISAATGNTCVTLSNCFTSIDGATYILCIDMAGD